MPPKFCGFQRDYDPNLRRFYCAIGDWQNKTPLCSYQSRLPRKGCSIAACEGVRVEEFLEGRLVPSNPASAMFAISFDAGDGVRIDLAPIPDSHLFISFSSGGLLPGELEFHLNLVNLAMRNRLQRGFTRSLEFSSP